MVPAVRILQECFTDTECLLAFPGTERDDEQLDEDPEGRSETDGCENISQVMFGHA